MLELCFTIIVFNEFFFIFSYFSYCIVFELEKVTKACKKDRDFNKMEKGKNVNRYIFLVKDE